MKVSKRRKTGVIDPQRGSLAEFFPTFRAKKTDWMEYGKTIVFVFIHSIRSRVVAIAVIVVDQ